MEFVGVSTLPDNWDDPVLSCDQAQALLKIPHHYLIVAANDDMKTCAGYILLQAVPGAQADILTIYVQPNQRRKKLGQGLLREALDMARNFGCEGLTLEVATTNLAAITLYETHGFQKRGKRVGYYRDPVSKTQGDALVMAVSLT